METVSAAIKAANAAKFAEAITAMLVFYALERRSRWGIT